MRAPALGLVCLSLAIVAGAARAAHAKPTIAILGLEVVDNGGGVDEKSTKVAKDLTEALRNRAKVGTGPFTLAAGSDKDLLEMKLLSGCDNEATTCMAAMGQELAADKLLYGKVEKQTGGYQITLRLLDVSSKSNDKTTTDIIPVSESTGSELTRWGKQLYNRLSGGSDQGTLLVKANVDRGTVYIDKQVKGSLVGGTARIAGLSDGSHTLAIEAEGKLRYEAKVTVSGGEETTANAELENNTITIKPKDHSQDGDHVTGELGGSHLSTEGTLSAEEHPGRLSRALFWTSLVVTASSATGMTITGLQVRGPLREDKENAIRMWQMAHPGNDQLSGDDACSPAANLASMGDQLAANVDSACQTGKNRALITNVLVGTTIVAAAATVVFYYKGYVAAPHASEHASRGKQRPTVVFAPAVSPNQVGAALRIDF
jgi:PEGA domain